MLTLTQALDKMPWRFLLLVGRNCNLKYSSNIKKDKLVKRLMSILAEPEHLSQKWSTLSPQARSVLLDLLQNKGELDLSAARRRYGNLREPGQILLAIKKATDNTAQTFPLLERLLLQGLIFYDKQNQRLLLPHQIALQLQSLNNQRALRQSLPLPGGSNAAILFTALKLQVHLRWLLANQECGDILYRW